MGIDDHFWILGLRIAGVLHFVTLASAIVTPIPPNWDANLASLPEIHRRFAVAQNFFIGLVIAASGLISITLARHLIDGTILARTICLCIASWWGGRLLVLPWLQAHRHLNTSMLRFGYGLLLAECGIYALGYGYFALR